jgi:hypothetical protein
MPMRGAALACRLALAVAMFFVLAGSGCLSVATPPYLKEDPEVTFLEGYLTWNGGVGGIAWSSSAPTSDPGGVSDVTYYPKAQLGWTLKTNTGSDAGYIPYETFTSQPVAKDYWLNVSHAIKMELYIKGNECSNTKASSFVYELWLNTNTFVGGQVPGHYPDYYAGPEYVGGYCIDYVRMHPEISKLSAGDVLTLKIYRHSEIGPAQYGMGEGHRSVIRFEYYPLEELQQRIPQFVNRVGATEAGAEEAAPIPAEQTNVRAAPEAEPSPAASAAAEALGAGTLGILAVAGLARSRRTDTKAVVVALAFLLLALAGCIGDSTSDQDADDGSRGKVHVDIEADANASLGKGLGALLGTIVNDLRYPVSGAHVALLGTTFATTSDAKGKFSFLDLDPGAYGLRIDHKSYLSVESKVKIVADNVTKVTVTVVPRVDKGPGFRPHMHDEWGTATRLPLWEGNVQFPQYDFTLGFANQNAKGGVCLNVYNLAHEVCAVQFHLVPPDGAPNPLILPGTYEVEIKVTWDASQNTVNGVGLGFRDNSQWLYNQTWLYPRKSGEPFHLKTNWEMGDVGHQRFNTWDWMLYIPTWSGSEASTVVSVSQLVRAPFKVEMSIIKGVVPLESEHPDFWAENNTLEVLKRDEVYINCIACTYPDPYGGSSWTPHKIIPPGTKWLEITVEQTRQSLNPLVKWGILYRSADVPPGTPFSKWGKLVATGSEGSKTFYNMAIEDGQTDAFYQQQSFWQFALDDNEDHASTSYDGQPIQFYMTIKAHKDPMRS